MPVQRYTNDDRSAPAPCSPPGAFDRPILSSREMPAPGLGEADGPTVPIVIA